MTSTFDRATLPQLALGCASLGGRIARRESLRVLERAAEAGVTKLDTARAYGFGEGEAILGQFLRRRRERFLVCTKGGISPGRHSRLLRPAKAIARSVLARWPAARASVQAAAAAGAAPTSGNFSPAALRSSLHQSLAALNTDYVDIFLLHAAPMEVVERDEVLSTLLELKRAGKARLVGVSGTPAVALRALECWQDSIDVVQYPANLLQADDARVTLKQKPCVRMLYHPLDSGNLPRQIVSLLHDPASDLTQELREKIARDPLRAAVEIGLSGLVAGSPDTWLLTAMHSPETLAANVAALTNPILTDAELAVAAKSVRLTHSRSELR